MQANQASLLVFFKTAQQFVIPIYREKSGLRRNWWQMCWIPIDPPLQSRGSFTALTIIPI